MRARRWRGSQGLHWGWGFVLGEGRGVLVGCGAEGMAKACGGVEEDASRGDEMDECTDDGPGRTRGNTIEMIYIGP